MAGRYEVSDNGWALIEDIVSPLQSTEGPHRDDRLILDHLRERCRGGLTSEVHMLCERYGWPLTFTLSPERDSDTQPFIPTIEYIHLPGPDRRPIQRCNFNVADKSYSRDTLRRYCARNRMKPNIARRKMKRKPRLGAPRGFHNPRHQNMNVTVPYLGLINELR